MEFNATHDTIRINETALDRALEQPIELEYTLPDYYQSIFKLLKCRVSPHIYSCRNSGDKLVMDGVAVAHMMYVDEEENKLHSIVQKIPFSKSADLNGGVQSPVISYNAKTDYVNCRVVNPRKIDLRGAITIHVTVVSQRDEAILGDAQGAGVQLNRSVLPIGGEHIWENRQFSISEQIDLDGHPPIGELISVEVTAASDSCKLISNKAITKGTAYLHILYRAEDEKGSLHSIDTEIPMSQILDMPGVDEDYQCDVKYEATTVETSTIEGGLEVDADITVCCFAFMPREMQIITDAFSTAYDINPTKKNIRLSGAPLFFREKLVSNQSFDLPHLREIYDAYATITNLSGISNGEAIEFTASLNLVLSGCDENSEAAIDERVIPISLKIPIKYHCDEPVIDAQVVPICIEHSIEGQRAELKVTILLQGKISCSYQIEAITDIAVDEESPKEASADALTIYYPEIGETVWDIAKQFSSSVDAIMKENELEHPVITNSGMLMIPIA